MAAEANLRKALRAKLNEFSVVSRKRCIFWSNSDTFISGLPDMTIVWRGQYIAVELKAPDGVLSPLQKKTLTEVHTAGGRSCVIRKSASRGKFVCELYPTDESFEFTSVEEFLSTLDARRTST